ncbi:MAG: EF-P beta-lysylation protein EpmB [Pseudomonadota bacterium]
MTLATDTATWQHELSNVLSDPVELCEVLGLNTDEADRIEAACAGFPLRIPRPYLQRIRANNPNDPLLLQALPTTQELIEDPAFSVDPLEEADVSPVNGLLHKYAGRVLIVLNGHCAIHCRYCFRRHFPYADHRISPENWTQILDHIRSDDSIHEVIFSGGDPLSCNDDTLARRINSLADIEHVSTIRFHTRLPIMIPQRVTPSLIDAITSTRLHCVMVMHCNHAQEIDERVSTAFDALHQAGIVLLNQSVLLKGINDNVHTLKELSQVLFHNHTLPYYIHLLDSVQGAAHFNISRERASIIHSELRASLPGYLVPNFAMEEAKARNKTVI